MAKRGNKEGTITKLPNGSYMGKIMLGRKENGKPNRVSVYRKTRKEVSDKLITLASQVINGTYIEPTKLTFGEWLTKWLKDYKSINLKPKTYDTYESQIMYHIIPEIGNIELKNLKTWQLQHFYNIKYNGGKGLASATIRKIHGIIHSALKQAQINSLIIKNSAIGVELPRLEQKKIKVFSQEEQNKFFEAAKKFDMYNAFLLAIDTGLRMGEILAICWEDIDLKSGIITIDKNIVFIKDREGITGNKNMLLVQDTPKTRASIRKVPLTQRALKMLKEMNLKSNPSCNLVFASRKLTHIDPRNFERAFQTVVDKADIEKCNSHTLRHTFATRCFEKGVSVKIISKWLGHNKISHTLDIYTYVFPDIEMEAIKVLEGPVVQRVEDNENVTQFTTQLTTQCQ
ncbi:MAG: tyrosine-type recombinase/integrase [Ruminiclostridium sp.]